VCVCVSVCVSVCLFFLDHDCVCTGVRDGTVSCHTSGCAGVRYCVDQRFSLDNSFKTGLRFCCSVTNKITFLFFQSKIIHVNINNKYNKAGVLPIGLVLATTSSRSN
jgi:hypothetical protein